MGAGKGSIGDLASVANRRGNDLCGIAEILQHDVHFANKGLRVLAVGLLPADERADVGRPAASHMPGLRGREDQRAVGADASIGQLADGLAAPLADAHFDDEVF